MLIKLTDATDDDHILVPIQNISMIYEMDTEQEGERQTVVKLINAPFEEHDNEFAVKESLREIWQDQTKLLSLSK